MEEILKQARSVLRGAWKHRRLGMVVAWLIGAVAAGVILRIPDKYEASARIFVDTQSILKPLMSGLAVQPNIDQQVMMLSRTLISRPNVEKLIHMSNADLNIKSKAEQEALIERFTNTLKIKSTDRDNLYTISFRDVDPAKAQRVVQSLVSIFVESSLGGKREDSDSARKFIGEQIRNYENKLEEAENRLKDFKLRNIETQAPDGKSGVEHLSDISTMLEKSKLELREAENARDALRRQIVGVNPVLLPESSGADDSVSMPEIDSRIDAQKRNLDALLQKYTDKHPDVLGTRRLIKELEEQKRQEIITRQKFAAANPGAGISASQIPQQLKVALASSEASVASLRARVSEYEARYKRANQIMKSMPQIEAEFAQLNRDYEIHKKNYEQLVARRESAELTGDLESAGAGAAFRLIDPPRASSNPVAPNRLLLLPLGLLLAIGGGIFSAYVASQLRPVFFDGKTLRDETGLPLLGIVSLVPNKARQEQERKTLTRFAAAGAALVALYVCGIGVLFYMSHRAA